VCIDVNAMEVKIEADGNDMTERPHNDQQSSGMFGFLIVFFLCLVSTVLSDICITFLLLMNTRCLKKKDSLRLM